ncbi:MAG: competence/damage-inducible protein A [Acutalibacteraceae bacterium]|nr:competence/damage-inducible protein A [Acutalibacteraceae bacterium]
MHAEIISVGTEILLGEIVNTDAQYLAEGLKMCGISSYYQSAVGDNPTRLKQALKQALERSDIVIFSGGLGPTDDDITLSTVCKALNIEQKLHTPTAEKIKAYFESTGRECPENNLKQAMLPENCIVFDNEVGTAPGCAIQAGGQSIIVLPGVPRELEVMFEKKVKPYLQSLSDEVMVTKTVKVIGIGESKANEMIGEELFSRENPSLGIYCAPGEVRLRVCAKSDNTVAAEALCKPVVNKLKKIFGDSVYTSEDKSIEQVVVNLLSENGKTVATAESCTAGLISKRITDVSGSSKIFSMGVAAYSADTKIKLLSVPPSLIQRKGTVCKEVAVYMALGVKNKSGADYGVGVTGVAGGSVENKPNGLVYIAVTDAQQYWVKELRIGHGTDEERDYVRQVASSYALDMVRRAILGIGEDAKPLKLKSQKEPVVVSQESADAVPEEVPQVLPVEPENVPQVLPQELPVVQEEVPQAPPESTIEIEQDDEPLSIIETEDTQQGEILPQGETDKKKKKSILSEIFPSKGDRPGEIIRKLALILLTVVILVSLGYIVDHYTKKFNNDHLNKTLQADYDETQSEVTNSGMKAKFLKLYKKNTDIKGWLKINNTQVDGPVYQTTDNDFYISHNANKEPSSYGALFADANAIIGESGNSKNICIYGHHMKDGSMLADLHEYKDIEFYKQNPTFSFDTLYNDADYKVFAAFITNAETKDDNGYFFDYTVSQFLTDGDFLSWVEQVKARSLYQTAVDVIASDEILTLSTCTYELSGVELRFVVCARKVRDGEDLSVNTDSAQLNASPIYPQVWYDKRGGEKPEGASSLWYGTLMSEHTQSVNQMEQERIEASMRAESERQESERLESERIASEQIVSQMIASIEAESRRLESEAAMIESQQALVSSSQQTSSESLPFYQDENGNIVINESFFNTLSAYSVVSYDNTSTQAG